MATLLQDLKYGLRMLAKNPGFTAVAVITLALGIAATTTIFSGVSGMLLRRPPVRDSDSVMMVLSNNPAKAWERNPVSVPDFVAWREQNHAFEDMAASDWSDFSLTGEGEPRRLTGMRVSASYFPVLGASAALGRTFLPAEDQPGHEHVVILSQGLWQRRFASDPNVIGKAVRLNGESYTVVGIMPARFKPVFFFDPQLWTPLAFSPERLTPAARDDRSLDVIARLKPGITVEMARAEMATIARHVEQSYPRTTQGWSATAMPLHKYIIEEANVKSALLFLMGSVVFVLLIACANIANLQLARAAVRQKEFAIRAALGAGRFRLIRQLLVESLLIALSGGGLGLLLAGWGVELFRSALNWQDYVRSMALEITIDQTVLAFTLGASVLAAILFGLAPAIHGTVTDLNSTLKEGGRTASSGASRNRGRSVLVAGEIALALVLLIGAGLFLQEFVESLRARFGIDPNQVLTANISLSSARYNDPLKQAAFFENVIQHLEALPGVISAGATTILPPHEQGQIVTFSIEGRPVLARPERPQTRYFAISPHYLQTMRIPLMRGREFAPSDKMHATPVALVSQAFVQHVFPSEPPIGKHIRIDTGNSDRPDWSEIVGVVGNVKDWFGEPNDAPQVYEPYLQRPSSAMTSVVRTSFDPTALAPMLRRAVWDVDKDQPVTEVRTMKQVIADSGAGDRLMSILMGVFAALALALATVGIFGVIAYMVAQRTHEIGIRMAVGAQRRDVLRLVVGRGVVLSAFGAVIGLGLAAPLPRLLTAAFVGFNVRAAPVFLGALLLVSLVALLASYIPARRATKVDPMVALRYE